MAAGGPGKVVHDVCVTTTYIMVEDYGFGLPYRVGVGLLLGAVALFVFLAVRPRLEWEEDQPAGSADQCHKGGGP